MRDIYVRTLKQRFRVRYVGGMKIVEGVVARQPPLSAVESQPVRWHRYTVLDVRTHQDTHRVLASLETLAYEAQYTIGSDLTIRHMVVRSTAPCWQWPPSYVRKTITYRFRW